MRPAQWEWRGLDRRDVLADSRGSTERSPAVRHRTKTLRHTHPPRVRRTRPERSADAAQGATRVGGSRGPKPSDRTPLRTPAATDLPLTLVVAPAFFGISVPAESRAEAEGARPAPSGANLQPSPSIPAREAVEQTAGAGNALCACARSGGSGPVAYTSALPQERHLLAGGSKTPRRPLILDRGSGQQEMGSWAPPPTGRTRRAERQLSSRSRSQPADMDRAQSACTASCHRWSTYLVPGARDPTRRG